MFTASAFVRRVEATASTSRWAVREDTVSSAPQAPEINVSNRVTSPLPPHEVLRRLPARVECVGFYAGKGRYRAICLDFSLVAESDISMLDAAERLTAQIQDYVLDIIEAGCPPHLVHRGFSQSERFLLWLRLALSGATGLLAALGPPMTARAERVVWRQPTAFACP